MYDVEKLADRFRHYNAASYRRLIAGAEVILHCHGSIDERFGTFASAECQCTASEQGTCVVAVEKT